MEFQFQWHSSSTYIRVSHQEKGKYPFHIYDSKCESILTSRCAKGLLTAHWYWQIQVNKMIIHEYSTFLFFIGIRKYLWGFSYKYTHIYADFIHTLHILCFSTSVIVFPFHIETECQRALQEHLSLRRVECIANPKLTKLRVGGKKGGRRGSGDLESSWNISTERG